MKRAAAEKRPAPDRQIMYVLDRTLRLPEAELPGLAGYENPARCAPATRRRSTSSTCESVLDGLLHARTAGLSPPKRHGIGRSR